MLSEIAVDFSGSFVGHCSDLIVFIRTLVGGVVTLAFWKVDEQMALCREPCPFTNESQFGISEMTCKDRANFDKFAVSCIKGILGVDHDKRLATDLTIDASDRSLVVGSQIF